MFFATRRTLRKQKPDQYGYGVAAKTRYARCARDASTQTGWSSERLDQADWFDQVVSRGDGNDVLIYVHGFNTEQQDTFQRLEMIEKGLRKQGYLGAIIAYDWPSRGARFFIDIDYNGDRKKTIECGPHLVGDIILPLLSMPNAPRVHLFSHSMGGLVVLNGFAGFGDSHGPGAGPWSVDQVVFAAADVPQYFMEKGAWGSLVMTHHSKRFTNYYSYDDSILRWSRRINSGRARLGSEGLASPAEKSHEDVSCTREYRAGEGSYEETRFVSHRWWFESEAFFADFAGALAGKDGLAEGTRRRAVAGDFILQR
ncbi:alpha/beta fold hydrolase [Planktotalea sp.]|uniref:alpha/beta fold hydrolase n=1 Tax=Planktotalea sp. TaxID=2029877 RepID=UPI003D6BB449